MMDWGLCQLLIDCIIKDESALDTTRLSSLSLKRWEAFLKLATAQRVRPLLWHKLKQKGLNEVVPAEISKTFKDAFRQNTLCNLRFFGEIRRLLFALKPEGIPLILLKGIFLADTVYSNLGLREMSDIDVLARPTDLARIAEILTDMGYTPLQPICVDTTMKSAHHLPRMVNNGLAAFEIHWNLTNPGEKYSIDPGCLWEHAVPIQIAGCDALTLSPEDLLLHLCLHTSYQHQFAFGLRPFCDIAETIAHFDHTLDWQIIVERAIFWGWQRGVYLSLRLASEVAGAAVPVTILERLKPKDTTKSVLEEARLQIFTDKRSAISIPAPFAELLESRHLWNKIRIFWHRVFLPKTIISSQYNVPMESIKIYCCYPRRLVDVLRRHKHTLKKYQENDALICQLAKRNKYIANWMER